MCMKERERFWRPQPLIHPADDLAEGAQKIVELIGGDV